jgi:hypothetical protein
MATFSKQPLSGNSSGLGILVNATSSTGDTIHTSAAGTTFDEVWLYATNNDASAVNLTIEYGTTTATNVIKLSVPATSGLTIIIPGLILGPSKTVSAYAASAGKVVIFGYVNRIS